MKSIPIAMVALASAGLVGACSAFSPSSKPPALEPRTSAADAAERIASARCERAIKCTPPHQPDGDKYACMIGAKRTVDTNFAQNPSCKNGVSIADLDNCLSRIEAEACTTENVETGLACRSRNLCLE